jgi:CRISPR-associated endonuclease/helicase Cas3
MTDFPGFFRELWASTEWPEPQPFPWQTMLAERAASADWPRVISLPTASGKTACLDAAVFGLAATASRRTEERLPRRIWFVVDRRIVVDEAYERAQTIASRLASAQDGPVFEISQALRTLSGTERPLAVARLRGGTWISKDWARRPGQPTIICSTVDQVGSALLFRAYGHSDETASIYAGLAAHDSMIILDEAHCAVPFMQTIEALARFREAPWAERPIKTPFHYCIMSATPPDGYSEASVFPKPPERAAALDHPVLQKRITALKLATLEKPVKGNDEDFASAAAAIARDFKEQGKPRIAVMVNRISTAKRTADQLRQMLGDTADVVLLTGRMRPLDRDALLERWTGFLKAGSRAHRDKPVVVVTTQCLEVGADFSFDALVTECASLDALRQRFGRLDRLGDLRESEAAILIRERDTKQAKDHGDPIYGQAIYETWTWLNELDGAATADFGIAGMDERVNALRAADPRRFQRLLAPSDDAPILLPAHLDLLCQTSPRPVSEPDVALFLHGKIQPAPEVRVAFRADVKGEDQDIDILSLVPPTSPELLPVPLHRLKAWLRGQEGEDTGGDVEGLREEKDSPSQQPTVRGFVIWKGRGRSEVTDDIGRMRPNDIVVLPLSKEAILELGQAIDDPQGLGPDRLDLAELAFSQARRRAVLRVHRDVLGPLRVTLRSAILLALAESDPNRSEVQAALDAVLAEHAATGCLPDWLERTIKDLRSAPRLRIEDHPTGGLILIGRAQPDAPTAALADAEGEDDLSADAR